MRARRWVSAALAVVAVALVLASARVERVGGQAVYNDECALGFGREACLEDQEVAGLPLAFLIDSPGVSVIHKVGLEDRFVPWAFAANVAVVWLALLALASLARRLRRRHRTPSTRL